MTQEVVQTSSGTFSLAAATKTDLLAGLNYRSSMIIVYNSIFLYVIVYKSIL